MELIKHFISKRNTVALVKDGKMFSVLKTFPTKKTLDKEIAIYKILKENDIPCASLISSDNNSIMLSFIDGDTCQAILDSMEENNNMPDMQVWEKLVDWILDFNKKTGLIIEDSNLRNFIISKSGQLYALDFESCKEGKAIKSVASVCAFILMSNPENTPKKKAIVEHISKYFCEKESENKQLLDDAITAEKAHLSARRMAKSSGRICENCSAVVLAGGKSERMGTAKADLKIGNTTFIQLLVNRLKAIGFTDIMVSGYSKPVDSARNIPDIYDNKGPLAGIYSCMSQANNSNCLVISVDSPLVPKKVILNLVKEHKSNSKNVTILTCNGDSFYVLGVYSTVLLNKMEKALKNHQLAIRKAIDEDDVAKYTFNGDNLLISGCNTPEEYKKTVLAFSQYENEDI